ncbi:BglG family transcription antiterminator [Clostridium neuense]|uniref:BglG family transcription antiterminator n=1 Tax=Clostridium neuense TaxID=1728934 RepID=A0ABW8TAD1_9CLOT
MIGRQIKLLKLLYKQNEYKPASFFSKALSVSTKTIYSDIKELNCLTKRFHVSLQVAPRNGILLVGSKDDVKSLFKHIGQEDYSNKFDTFSPDFRRFNIVKRVFLNSENPSLEELSKEFMVSKTSIYKDLEIIEKVLINCEIHILTDNDGIRVVGKELAVQKSVKQFIFSNILNNSMIDLQQKLTMIIEEEVITKVSKLLFEDYAELTEEVSEYYIKSLLVTIIIQVQRLKHGFHMEVEETFLFNNIRYMETYIVSNSMVELLSKEFNIKFHTEDVEFLCKQLFAHRITNNVKGSNTEYSDIIKRLIERMSKIEKVDLSNDKRLYRSLLYHLPAMILRLKRGIEIKNPVLDMIKDQYSKMFSIVWYALSIIEMEYDVSLNDDEVSLIVIYFQIALDSISKANNIVIICPYGVSSSQFIYSKVIQLLPAKDNFEVSSLKKLYLSDLDNVDLIISTVDINDIEVPIVKVSPLLSSEDCSNIMMAYSKYILDKKNRIIFSERLENFTFPCLSKFIDPSLIKLNVAFSSKEECLNFMISELERREYVGERFRKSIFNREKMGVTSLDSGTALPHADPTTVKKSSVSIVTLKHPIKWGGIDVCLVIMVSFSENDIYQFRDVITETYQLIEKSEYVREVLKISTIEEMADLFYQ